jgi:ParB-like chromosome segregation protein Spo0J
MSRETKSSCRGGRPHGRKPRPHISIDGDTFAYVAREELLAADIKANGLLHPIVVDKEGALIDGRNRARAWEIAGVEPTIMVFDGDDPRAFIPAAAIHGGMAE